MWECYSEINLRGKCEMSQQLVTVVAGELCDLGGGSLQVSLPAAMERTLTLRCLSPAPSF